MEKEITIKVDESVLSALNSAITAIAEVAAVKEDFEGLSTAEGSEKAYAAHKSFIADLRFMEDWLGNLATTVETALEDKSYTEDTLRNYARLDGLVNGPIVQIPGNGWKVVKYIRYAFGDSYDCTLQDDNSVVNVPGFALVRF